MKTGRFINKIESRIHTQVQTLIATIFLINILIIIMNIHFVYKYCNIYNTLEYLGIGKVFLNNSTS